MKKKIEHKHFLQTARALEAQNTGHGEVTLADAHLRYPAPNGQAFIRD
jgi:hypothetical protein